MSRRRAAVPPDRERHSREERSIHDSGIHADSSGGRLVGYRLIRRVASGDRADLFLAAADLPTAMGAGSEEAGAVEVGQAPGPPLVVLRVYRPDAPDASVALEIEAMSTDTTGTLPTLHDVANLDDGRCALAVERIGGVSLSRLLDDRTLSPGESVTLLAPIVVAVAALARRGYVHGRLAVSDVLIDDRGRPRLVGLGALRRLPERAHSERTALLREAHAALADLISEVAAAVRPAGALDGVVDVLRERLEARPFQSCETELERRLFELAPPEPIGGVDVRPRAAARLPARVVAPTAIEERDAGDDPMEAPSRGARRGFVRTVLELAQVPGDVAERFGRDGDADRHGIRGRLLELVARRRRSLTVGGLVGGSALVLLLTLVPPATADDASDAAADHAAPGAESSAARSSETEASVEQSPTDVRDSAAPSAAPPSAPDELDPVAAASGLLERRAECFQTLDLSCLDEVVQPGSPAETADRAALIAARDGDAPSAIEFDLSAITVTAEMGGAMLVNAPRMATEREPASLLMVRGEAGWRLREIVG